MRKLITVSMMTMLFCLMGSIIGSNVYAEKVKELNWGIITALTGPASPWGIPNSRAMSMGADRINEAGGFQVKGETYKWKIIVYDSKYVPAETVKALNRAIHSDKVYGVTIMGGSPLLASIPLLKQNNMLSLNDAAGGKAVTNPDNPLVFRFNPGIEGSYAVGLKYLKEKYRLKTVAAINPDDETGRANLDALKYVNQAAGFNLDIVSSEFFERGSKDFMPLLTRIIAKKPDLIETGMTDPTTQALILKQARELGYKGPIYLIWGPNEQQVLQVAGPLAEGAYLGVTGPVEPTTAVGKELYQRFLKQYPANEWDANYYTHSSLFDCLTKAIVEAQSFDPVIVANTLENLKWEGAWGTYSWGGSDLFGIKRQMLMPLTLLRIEGGKSVVAAQGEVPPGILD